MPILVLLTSFAALADAQVTRTAQVFPLAEITECLPTSGATHRLEFATSLSATAKKTELKMSRDDGTLVGRQTLDLIRLPDGSEQPMRWTSERLDLNWSGSASRLPQRQLVLESREGESRKSDTVSYDSELPLLFGSSVSGYVVAHFKELLARQSLKVQILAIDRMALYTFSLTRVEPPAAPEGTEKCPRSAWQKVRENQWFAIEMRPDSAVLRLFAPTMIYWANSSDGKIQAYYGPNEVLKKSPSEIVKGLSWFAP